jgi:hypothetical protein
VLRGDFKVVDNKQEMIPLDEAKKAVEITCQRLALLHVAFARTIVNELGEKEGKKMILKAIKSYGNMIGEKVKADVKEMGLEAVPQNYGAGKSRDLPAFGMHTRRERVMVNGETRTKAYGCVMGELWNKMGEGDLGRLYCYVDPAKYMAFNPNFKLCHMQAIPSGGECCEMAVRPTTEQERKDFAEEDADWSYVDQEGL